VELYKAEREKHRCRTMIRFGEGEKEKGNCCLQRRGMNEREERTSESAPTARDRPLE